MNRKNKREPKQRAFTDRMYRMNTFRSLGCIWKLAICGILTFRRNEFHIKCSMTLIEKAGKNREIIILLYFLSVCPKINIIVNELRLHRLYSILKDWNCKIHFSFLHYLNEHFKWLHEIMENMSVFTPKIDIDVEMQSNVEISWQMSKTNATIRQNQLYY